MNGRSVAAEFASLVVTALWAYAGVALVVALFGDGQTASFGVVAAAVVLSYGLAWVLQRFDINIGATRAWGLALSVGLLYLILRIEIAGEPYLWELAWVGDVLADTETTLEGRGGDVALVVLLSFVWMRGVMRAGRELIFEGVLAEVGFGLIVVLLAVAAAPGADAPAVLRWLPLPYMVAALLSLSLMHLQSVHVDRRRPFLGAWMLWMGAYIGGMAALALLATFFDPPSLAPVWRAIAFVGKGIGLALFYALSPIFVALVWVMRQIVGLFGGTEPFLLEDQEQDVDELLRDDERDPAGWLRALGYALRFGLIGLIVALALGALWFAFSRFRRRRQDEDEVREEVETGEGGALGGLQSMLSTALGRLRGRGSTARGRDAVGRLYFSMLLRASGQGLPRPPSATPREFAPRLEAHFDSAVPRAVSDAYAETRYGGRPPPPREVDELRSRWDEVSRGQGGP